MILVTGGCFLYVQLQSPRLEQSLKELQQSFADKDTITFDKIIDTESIANNLWPRFKVLYQESHNTPAAGIISSQENDAKDVVKQLFYQAIRGTKNLISEVFNQFFTTKPGFKINGDTASIRLDYTNQGTSKSYSLDFIFKKSGKTWQLVDVQGLENILMDFSPESESIKQLRDSQRISDLSILKSSIGLYMATALDPIICTDKNKGQVYRSNQGMDAVDGSGWLPIDFNKVAGGTPIDKLPQDPINKDSFVYSYVCNSASQTFEFNAIMESQQYSEGGTNDVVSTDGGDNPNTYEVGASLKLIH